MSHIHIPDGVLPIWLWLPGWLLTLGAVYFAARIAERSDARRKVPLLGVVAALMLVSMSTEVVPIAYHINLTVVGAVLLGPLLSVIAAFIAEVVLAMLGHGGVTVLGLNTVVIASEMVLGWALFRGLTNAFGLRRVRFAAGLATAVTLAITTSMVVGIVALSGATGATQRETGALDPSSLQFANPFSDSIVSVGLFAGGEEGEHGAEEAPAGELRLSVRRFAAVVYTLGPIGWLIEALVTAWILGYVARVRPELVAGGLPRRAGGRLPGDTRGGR